MEQPAIICLGNGGVGKSSTLNRWRQKIAFQAGVSLGGGMTKHCQIDLAPDGTSYIDTPPLSDLKLRKQAALEIKNVLAQGGLFKIFFLITLEEGRIRADDKTTIKLVLDAAPVGSSYSVIINKVNEEILKLLEDKKNENQLLEILFAGLEPTMSYFLNKYDENLAGKKNVLEVLDSPFAEFVRNAPTVFISKEQVKDIKENEFELVKEYYGKQIQDMEASIQNIQRKIIAGNTGWSLKKVVEFITRNFKKGKSNK